MSSCQRVFLVREGVRSDPGEAWKFQAPLFFSPNDEGRAEAALHFPYVGAELRCWIGDGRAEDVAVTEGCRAIAIRRWLWYGTAGEQGLAIGINRRAIGGIPHIVPDAYNHIIGRRSIVVVA
jgi:hypothetical protein